jgi:hypothetical protein
MSSTGDTDPAGPVGRDQLRVSNAERQGVVERLNAAFAEGRLEVAELDERVQAAYAAKTVGDLRRLVLDLPLPRDARGNPALPAKPAADREIERSSSRAAVGGALGLFLVNVLIWAAVSLGTREWIYFWPIWTAIPFVFAVMGVASQSRRDRRRDG